LYRRSCDSGEQRFLRFFKRLNGHLAGYGGKLPQKLVERESTFQIIDEVLEGNARASKAGDAV
jgi:hypothetical protein